MLRGERMLLAILRLLNEFALVHIQDNGCYLKGGRKLLEVFNRWQAPYLSLPPNH